MSNGRSWYYDNVESVPGEKERLEKERHDRQWGRTNTRSVSVEDRLRYLEARIKELEERIGMP